MSNLSTQRCPIVSLLGFLADYIREDDQTFVSSVVQLYYTLFFFRLSFEAHSPALLHAWRTSDFAERAGRRVQSALVGEPLASLTLTEFAHHAEADFQQLKLYCQVRLDECGELRDRSLARAALSLLPLVSDDTINHDWMEAIFSFFLDRNSLSEARRFTLSERFSASLESALESLSRVFRVSLARFQQQIAKLISKTRALLTAPQKLSGDRTLAELRLVQVSREMNILSQSEFTKPRSAFKRKNLFGFAFCPTRRMRRLPFIPSPSPFSDPPASEFRCIIQGFTCKRPGTFAIHRKGFALLPKRGAPTYLRFDRIRFLFARPLQFTIEIFTLKNKSYLLRFDDTDFPDLIGALQSVHFDAAEIVSLTSDKIDADIWQKKWIHREISNWEYIMILNILAGRSFRDPAAPPVAPSVLRKLSDYGSVTGSYAGMKFTGPTLPIESIESAFLTSALVPAGLFFDTSVIPKDGALPAWARKPIEFVYHARARLESPSLALPEWIDRAFGVRSHTKLFAKGHPSRKTIESPSLAGAVPLPLAVQHAHSFRSKGDRIEISVVSRDGQIGTIAFEVGGGESPVTFEKSGVLDSGFGRMIFSGAFAYSPDQATVFRLDDGRKGPLYAETSLFVAYGRSALFCPDRCTISRCCFRPERLEIRPVCHSEAEITVIAAHSLHQLVAFATMDGFIHIHDSVNGGNLSVYDTQREIDEIVITGCWGFVVAFTREELFIFSVNGEFLKTTTLAVSVAKVFPQSSASGFDVVSLITVEGDIVCAEALFPEAHTSVARVGEDVVNVFYNSNLRALVVVHGDGSVALHTYCLEFI
jgi:hypothetical protein